MQNPKKVAVVVWLVGIYSNISKKKSHTVHVTIEVQILEKLISLDVP